MFVTHPFSEQPAIVDRTLMFSVPAREVAPPWMTPVRVPDTLEDPPFVQAVGGGLNDSLNCTGARCAGRIALLAEGWRYQEGTPHQTDLSLRSRPRPVDRRRDSGEDGVDRRANGGVRGSNRGRSGVLGRWCTRAGRRTGGNQRQGADQDDSIHHPHTYPYVELLKVLTNRRLALLESATGR